MLMLVKNHGTTRGYMPRDGAKRCHTALRSRQMEQQMLQGDMSERQSTRTTETGAPKRCSSTSSTRYGHSGEQTWARKTDSVSRKKTPGRTGSCAAMSSRRWRNRYNCRCRLQGPALARAVRRDLKSIGLTLTTRRCLLSNQLGDRVGLRTGLGRGVKRVRGLARGVIRLIARGICLEEGWMSL